MNKFDTHKWNEYLMVVNGLNVGLNMPAAKPSVGEGETEFTHELPPYHRRKAFLVDEYPACPPEWMRSSGRIKSYFVPIIEGNGLWLDLNEALREVPQHVGVVVSVQGVNAVTGLPCKDAALEQYRDNCPKHKKAFGPDRFCADCGYKWPKQNYLSSAGTPEGQFWLDGFRAENGAIRQYVLTAAKARGVAKAIIGDDRVFALGLSFFLTKEKRQERPVVSKTRNISYGGGGMKSLCSPGVDTTVMDMTAWGGLMGDAGSAGPVGPVGPPGPPGATWDKSVVNNAADDGAVNSFCNWMEAEKESAPPPEKLFLKSGGHSDHRRYLCSVDTTANNSALYDAPLVAKATSFAASAAPPAAVNVKKMEIAAGARINQNIWDDPSSLDAYNAEPEGIIVINYCSEAEAEAIIAAGKISLSGSKDGFLKSVPTGNPV